VRGDVRLARCTERRETAFEEADRLHRPLVVLRPWRPERGVDLALAETAEQKSIDEYLCEWQTRYPHVGVSVELRRSGSAQRSR
jgi:hypothetical protein